MLLLPTSMAAATARSRPGGASSVTRSSYGRRRRRGGRPSTGVPMQIGVILSPTPGWHATLTAAMLADEAGLDTVGFWDHYHSAQPDWAYVCGWSLYGALAVATKRIHLVPV